MTNMVTSKPYWANADFNKVEFVLNGIQYRTNADASYVEGLDGKTWNRTSSARVHDAALHALGYRTEPRGTMLP